MSLCCEPGALRDAKAVLLVGDDEAEIMENGLFREERMRADDELDAPIGQPGGTGRRCAAVIEPVSSAIEMPSGASRRESVAACCSARISVGAMNAA